jgi:membrane-associated phospholipid phosphatase
LRTPTVVACSRVIGVAEFNSRIQEYPAVNYKREIDVKRGLQLSIVALIVAVFVVLAFIFDAPVRDWMTSHRSDGLAIFMRNVSRFGDWWAHAALGILLLAIAWARGKKRWTRVFLSMLIALALAGAVTRVIKIGVGRARPSVQTEVTWNGPSLSSRFHAFPSGHTAASTAFFALLFFLNWRIGLACLPIPILIGFSRMYVAAHYLSDIVCAAILGVLCALVVARFLLLPITNRQSQTEN